MEAVTAIIGGGIRVGIALQGKKVRDDSRTLQQAGLSERSSLDTLGFTLEPSFTHASPSMTPKKHPLALPCETNQQFPRYYLFLLSIPSSDHVSQFSYFSFIMYSPGLLLLP